MEAQPRSAQLAVHPLPDPTAPAEPHGSSMTAHASPLLLRAASAAAVAATLLTGGALAQTPQNGGTLTAIVQPEPVTLTSAINTTAPT